MPIALKFLCAALFILAAVPRLNISLGPVPIYGIDVCLLGAIYYGGLQRNPLFGKVPFASLVLAILGFALLVNSCRAPFSAPILKPSICLSGCAWQWRCFFC